MPKRSRFGLHMVEGFLCLMTYAEKLRRPRWQRKRLELLQSTDFTCELCGATDQQLQIHHPIYRVGVEPWDYPTDTLMVLCLQCHEERQEIERQFFYKVSLAIRYKNNTELKEMPVWTMLESRNFEKDSDP
jgi:5-methylcytosine-specific restriction endonuclease McrA